MLGFGGVVHCSYPIFMCWRMNPGDLLIGQPDAKKGAHDHVWHRLPCVMNFGLLRQLSLTIQDNETVCEKLPRLRTPTLKASRLRQEPVFAISYIEDLWWRARCRETIRKSAVAALVVGLGTRTQRW